MATKRQRGNTWHYTVKRSGLLPRPIYLTFDTEAEGDAYVERLEALLDRGVVPEAFLRRQHALQTVGEAIREYMRAVHISGDDESRLGVILEQRRSERLTAVDYGWCEAFVQKLKIEQAAPSTIRKHVGALARCFDWVNRRHADALPTNPMRQLPRGYATYSEADRKKLGGGREDTERDRRLEPGEEGRIRAVLAGEKPEGRQRPLELKWQGAQECLFDLALESAMRLREMYTLTLPQLDLARRTVFLEKTKNGDKRQVPLSTPAIAALERYIDQVQTGARKMDGFSFDGGRLFPWWNGEPGKVSLRRTTSVLSRQFGRVFGAAGCEGLHFHDLRHEATCRLYERTQLSDLQIAKITGHKDIRVLRRYANLRGSDLADEMW